MKMTSKIIQLRLAGWLDYFQNVCVPNTHATGYEADFLCLMASGFLDEYEIKISVADLKREFDPNNSTKANKHAHLLDQARHPRMVPIREWWLVLPQDLAIPDRVMELVPAHAGILRIPTDGRRMPSVERKPKKLPGYRKLHANEQWKIVRLGYIRYWNYHMRIVDDNNES